MQERVKRWYRVGGLVLLGLLILVFVYALRSVFYPVLVGFLIAYVFTPIVDWLIHVGLNRVLAVCVIYMVAGLALLAVALYGTPVVFNEVGSLIDATIGDEFHDADKNGVYNPPESEEEKGGGKDESGKKAPESDSAKGTRKASGAGREGDPLAYLSKGGARSATPTKTAGGASKGAAARSDRLTRDVNRDGKYDPGYIERLRLWAKGLVEEWNKRYTDRPDLQISMDNLTARLTDSLRAGLRGIREAGETIYLALRDNILALMRILGFLALTPIYAFFFMLAMHHMRSSMSEYTPARIRDRTVRILDEINQAISSFFRGRLLICFIDAILTCVVLYFCHTRFWILLGLMTGLFGIVPIVGPVLAYVPMALISVIDHGFGNCLWVTGGFWTVQAIDGFILTPLILGAKVRLHPVTLIIALFVGGKLFGAFGVLLAVPVVSILKILGKEFVMPQLRLLAREPAPGPSGQGSSRSDA